MNDYLAAIYQAKSDLLTLQIRQQRQIESLFTELAKQCNTTADLSNAANLSTYRAKLKNLINNTFRQIEGIQHQGVVSATVLGNAPQEAFFNLMQDTYKVDITSDFDLMFKAVNQKVINTIEAGNLYKGNVGLSRTIWQHSQMADKDIQNAITQNIRSRGSTADLASNISQYIDPRSAKLQKNVIGRKVEFNSMRLARTATKDAYRLSNLNTAQQNPFMKFLVYKLSPSHSARMHGRADICDEYASHDEGYGEGIFKMEGVTMEILTVHPQCLCTQYFTSDKSLDEISEELNAWIRGEDNPELDKYLKTHFSAGSSAATTTAASTVAATSTSAASTIARATSLSDLTAKYGVTFTELAEVAENGVVLDDRVYGYIDDTIANIDSKMPDGFKFNQLCDKVEFNFSAGDTVGSVYVRDMTINSRVVSNTERGLDNLIDNIDMFSNPRNKSTTLRAYNPLSTVTHETGHLIHNELLRRKGKSLYVSSGTAALDRMCGTIRKEVLESFGLTAKAADAGKVARQLSGYATESSHEFFAEAYAECLDSPTPRPMAKKFWEVLQKYVEGLPNL